jgi:hypothetical protein
LLHPGELLDTAPIFISRYERLHGGKDSGVCIQVFQHSSAFNLQSFVFSAIKPRLHYPPQVNTLLFRIGSILLSSIFKALSIVDLLLSFFLFYTLSIHPNM